MRGTIHPPIDLHAASVFPGSADLLVVRAGSPWVLAAFGLLALSACAGASGAPAGAGNSKPEAIDLRPPPLDARGSLSATPEAIEHGAGAGISSAHPAMAGARDGVEDGGVESLGAARFPFAAYLTAIHNRIHPHFADTFLRSLDSLPPGDVLNRPELATTVEIVIDGLSGKLARVGITKPSGVTAFDVGVIRSIQEASPFGASLDAIRSFDGNVYVTWSFHRDGMSSCSIREAIPMILAGPGR